MRSPFKFLDAFTLEDSHTFFGREKETQELYNMVFKSSLVLLYGLSGTGKTSLVQCGLASKFDGPDWFPLFIRRETNILKSWQEALNFHLNEEERTLHLIDKTRFLYGKYLSPIYLIFDQFEELFILGTKEEQNEFIHNIKKIIDAELACRIILIIREEYLGYLYGFEQTIPNMFDFRIRVEPMDTNRIKSVMTSSFSKFNISLEAPEELRISEMTNNLSAKKFGIQLPYLQVYLDVLYKREYKKIFRDKKLDEKFPGLTFSKKGIKDLGKIENVLEQFIQEQEENLEQELTKRFNQSFEGVVHEVIDQFATDQGTKIPVQFSRENGLIKPKDNFKALISNSISDQVLSACISGLEKRRILRLTDSYIELAHDSLASLVNNNRTEEQRQFTQTRRIIETSFKEYQTNEVFLTEKQLSAYEPFIPLLSLDKKVKIFIEKSKEEAERLKKIELYKKVTQLITSLAIALFLATVFSIYQWNVAIGAKNELAKKNIISKMIFSGSLKNKGSYAEAISNLNEAKRDIEKEGLSSELKDTLKQIIKNQKNYELMQKSVVLIDSILEKNDPTDTLKLKALKEYEFILSIEPDPLISVKKQSLESLIKERATIWYSRASIYSEFGDRLGRIGAREALEYAMKLNPIDTNQIESIRKTIIEKDKSEIR